LPYDGLSSDLVGAIETFGGPKILLIQDEYDMPAKTCAWIRRLGIDVVFTAVPPQFRETFYPADLCSGVEFRQCLTGYVPDRLPSTTLPIKDRALWVAYRGRDLPIWYGRLGREKYAIGQRIREFCRQHDIPHDIECAEDKRIYGDAWFEFLGSARATLGTESGSNVVDTNGEIRGRVLSTRKQRPELSKEEIYRCCVEKFDGLVRMNQISPKIFEAIALRTGLILFEGEYSKVIRPNEHFIPLRKDFSNVNEVMKQVSNVEYLQTMVDRAYVAVIESNQYSYKYFVDDVMSAIEARVGPRSERRWTYAVVACTAPECQWTAVTPHLPLSWPIRHRDPPPNPLLTGRLRQLWLQLPGAIRQPLIILFGPLARLLVSAREKSRGLS
jgi:hypothetical protein